MERKFLVVSLLIFLASLGYYLYTHYQVRSGQKQPAPAEEEPAAFSQPGIRVKSNDSSDTSSAPIVKKLDSLHSSNASGEAGEETTVVSDTAGSEAIKETQLPPELEALFKAFHSLNEKSQPVFEELDTLKMEHKSGTLRIMELSGALNGPHDEATRKALYKELEAVIASQTERGPRIFALQDEVQRLNEEIKAFFDKYGIPSWKAFFETYPEYKAWAATH